MKNNVVCILVDSIFWDAVGNNRCKVSPTPFLDSLQGETLTAEKLYSYGPYTDAATRSLYTGRRTLDDFGYYFQLNTAPKTHFDAFHDNGYETYGIYYPYYVYGKEIKKSIDHPIYSSGFVFSSEWGGIYEYYSKLSKERPLNEVEYKLLRTRSQLMFDTWLDFYNDLLKDKSTSVLIDKQYRISELKAAIEALTEEYNLFNNNKNEYINGILQEGMNHNLARIDCVNVDALIDRDYLNNKIYKRYNNVFKIIGRNNFIRNLFCNFPTSRTLYKCFCSFLEERSKDSIRNLINFWHCLIALKSMKRNSQKNRWQYLPSARRIINCAVSLLDNVRKDKPFYISMHWLDPHEYISFFSYDIQDDDIIKEEMGVIKNYVNKLGLNFKGSLPYLLTLRYADFCIEKFCEGLKTKGLWDSTTLMVVADHGSSFTYYPIHGQQVNCFYEECYHIPLWIRHPKLQPQIVTKYHSSKDIFPTLFDIVGIDKPDSFLGSSMRSDTSGKDYVLTEYMGPGCPDMTSKCVWFSARDDHYLVCYKIGVFEEFSSGSLCEVYDLKNDKNCYNNISETIPKSNIEYLLHYIKERHAELKIETNNFLNTLSE